MPAASPSPPPPTPFRGASLRRAAAAFVALGVAARVVRWLLDFPLWGDEAFVAANLIDASWRRLLQPLDYGQVAPPLFLWIELAAVRALGYGEETLRLFPLVAGALSVLLLLRLARRALDDLSALFAVAILAVSYYPIRHAAEVKPYSSDLLCALLVLLPAFAWSAAPGRLRWLAALAAASVVAQWLSYPSVFVAAGAGLALLPTAWRAGTRARAAFAGCALLGAANFAAFYLVAARTQMTAERYLFDHWSHTFPPWSEPLRLVPWLLEAHTGHLFAHPFGGKNAASLLTTLASAVGALSLARGGQRSLLALLLAPFALNLAAASLHLYPYGGSTRWMLHLAPAIALLAGRGAAVAVTWNRRREPSRRAVRAVLGALAALALFLTSRGIAKPYKSLHDLENRAFARRFWPAEGRGAELACAAADLGLELYGGVHESGVSAQYLCNQALYRTAPPPDLGRVAPGHPLRVVVYHPPEGAAERRAAEERLRDWLAERESDDLVLRDRRTFELVRRHEVRGKAVERVEVLELGPPATDR